MHRRCLRSLCGAGLVGAAGCAGETPTETPDTALGIDRVRVLPWLVAPMTPDSVGVAGDEDERDVLVTVDATGAERPPARDEFTLSGDDRTHEPRTEIGDGRSLDSGNYPGLVGRRRRRSGRRPALPFAVPERAATPTATRA